MRCVDVDPKDVLENRFTSEDVKFYLCNLGPAVFFLVLVSALAVVMSFTGGRNVGRGVLLILMTVLLLIGCASRLISIRVKSNKRLKESVDKFGRDILEMDLRNPNNEVYMLHPDKYETYVIVSSRYLYFAKESVFALDDIKEAYIDLNDMAGQNKAGSGNQRPYDHNNKSARETTRFCKPAYITTMDGQKKRCLVALEEDQMRQLDEFLITLGK